MNSPKNNHESSVRTYGKKPFRAALLHGGPGAPGDMAPVARKLRRYVGIIEPLQSADSIAGQVEELKQQIENNAQPPLALIGSSWGAVLALITAARHPLLADRLILIGSAVFDNESAKSIEPRRLARMDQTEKDRYKEIAEKMITATGKGRDELMAEWGELLDKSDYYDPLTTESEVIEVQYETFQKVFSEFVKMRDDPEKISAELENINVPVTLIHGQYDPHPIEGILPFLEKCLPEISYHRLADCGHYPWNERQARARFYDIIRTELNGR